MGIQNISPDVRGFLYNLFNKSSTVFDGVTNSPVGVAVPFMPGGLASAFRRVAFVARKGTLQDVNDALDALVQKVNTTTDPDVKEQIEEARLLEQLFYKGWVKNNKQLQADLGSFSSGIL